MGRSGSAKHNVANVTIHNAIARAIDIDVSVQLRPSVAKAMQLECCVQRNLDFKGRQEDDNGHVPYFMKNRAQTRMVVEPVRREK